MSVALDHRQRGRRSITAALPWVGMGLCLAAFLGYLGYDRLLGKPAGSGSSAALAPSAAKADGGDSAQRPPGKHNTVTLDDAKFAVAKIKLEEVRVEKISTGVSEVGQIQANSDRQVEVRPPRLGHRPRGQGSSGSECQARRSARNPRQRRDRHSPAELALQAARAFNGAVRCQVEVGNRRERRPADSRAETRHQREAKRRFR